MESIVKINRVWVMPNKNTFSIKPIKELIYRYKGGMVIDPFANKNKIADITNDIIGDYNTDHQLDALDFLKLFGNESVDTILFDPPFSQRQVAEVYKKVGRSVNMETTQNSFWSNIKKEISRIVYNNGIVISCSWNSGGIGKKYFFELKEILLCSHGSWHNDTIVVVEKKIRKSIMEFKGDQK